MAFQRGTSLAPYTIVSTTRRIDGLGGKIYSFWAMYSFRISFCVVPEIFFRSAPLFSATTRYIAQIIAAGELMVMEVVISWRGKPCQQRFHVCQGRNGHPASAHFTLGQRVVAVVAHESRQVEGDGEARLPLLQKIVQALVGVLGLPNPENWRMVQTLPRYMVL